MRREPLKLRSERLLGHLDGGLESLADTGLLVTGLDFLYQAI